GAVADRVGYRRGVRGERKAIITITNGWLLYGPNPSLAAPINDQVPTGPAVGIDPRTGKLTARGQTDPRIETIGGCERDRVMLAQLDDRDFLRRLPAPANRGNVSLYPIDPHGRPAFDRPCADPRAPAACRSWIRWSGIRCRSTSIWRCCARAPTGFAHSQTTPTGLPPSARTISRGASNGSSTISRRITCLVTTRAAASTGGSTRSPSA